MRSRSVLSACLLALTLAACSSTVAGKPLAAPGTADVPAALHALLEPAPVGTQPWATAWSDNETPTVEDFVARAYAPADQSAEATRLRSQGIVAIAHRAWVASDGRQADVVLLQFATTAGAKLRERTAVAAKTHAGDIRSFDVPEHPDVVGLYPSGIDDDGNYRAIVYAQKVRIVLELFYYCPEPFNPADAIAWTTAQLQLLPS